MNGQNVAESSHVVNILPSVSISGGKTALAFSMATAEHASILINFGAMGVAVPTSIVLNQCTKADGTGATAMGFRYYYQSVGGATHDILDKGPLFATSAGITTFPTTVANLVYVIEVDSAELEVIAAVVGTITEYPYLQLVIADSGNVTLASATALLTGARFAYKGSPSVTV